VRVSAVIALTLTPMCCAFILKPPNEAEPTLDNRIVAFIDARMEKLRHYYERLLSSSLKTNAVTVFSPRWC
jgi:multidrug efflux pump